MIRSQLAFALLGLVCAATFVGAVGALNKSSTLPSSSRRQSGRRVQAPILSNFRTEGNTGYVDRIWFAWDVGGSETSRILVEALESTCQTIFSEILIMGISPSVIENPATKDNHAPNTHVFGDFDISGIGPFLDGNGDGSFCACATVFYDDPESNGFIPMERNCGIVSVTAQTRHNFIITSNNQDDTALAAAQDVVKDLAVSLALLDDVGAPVNAETHVYGLSETVNFDFQAKNGLNFVDLEFALDNRPDAILIHSTGSQVPITSAEDLAVVADSGLVVIEATSTRLRFDFTFRFEDFYILSGRPGQAVEFQFSGYFMQAFSNRRATSSNRALEPSDVEIVPFSMTIRARAPGKEPLSPAAYGGIVFAMTFVIGIAGAFAYAAHKRRSNPQVYPAKKSTDAKTLKTSTTISSFGSDRSIDSNIRSVPTGVTKSQRDIETQLHAPRSQHSMKSPTRINDSQHNTKVQRSTKPTKSNKSTTCVGGGDRRPRSHHDAPSSRGSRRNMEHHRVASPRATTGRNGGRITSQGKPKPSSRDLHRPNSQPSASLKHHRKERKPTPKCHPSNEELV